MWGISYWVFPVISGCTWVGMLIAMLVVWCVEGEPHYSSMDADQHIAYISDIGAEGLKPLFIAGSCVTTIFLDLSFISERWLRHKGRLARNTTVLEKVLSILSMIFATIGTAGLILLSIFDTKRHPKLHDIFLLLFIAGYVISAIFICWEYQRLGIHYRQHRILRISFWIKLFFVLIEIALAIAFASCNFKGSANAAAVLEWAVAFLFTFYVLSFFVDLIPAVHAKGYSSDTTAMQMESNDPAAREHDAQHNAGVDYYGDGSRTGRQTTNGVNGHAGQPNGGFVANGVHYVDGPNGPQVLKPGVANNF